MRILMRIASLIAAIVWNAPAQETRSIIFGRVLDPTGAAVAGASVAVTNTDTNVSTNVSANENGYYEANLLLPGNYQVSVEAPGFKKSLRIGVVLTVATRQQIDFTMTLGAVAETVEVRGEAPLIETNVVNSGRLIDRRNVADLPVQGFNPMLLAMLTPGLQAGGVNKYNCLHCVGGSSDFSVDGKVGGNDFSVDGAPNSRGRSPAFLPAVDSVEEYKVETSGFDANIGHTTGAVVTLMTKAGTNAFHGTLSKQHWQ